MGVKRYYLWDPTTYKVTINKDVIFAKEKLQKEIKDDNYKKVQRL